MKEIVHWGDLSKDFMMCKQGQEQSPINIVRKDAKKSKLARLHPIYQDTTLQPLNGRKIKRN